MRPRTRLVSYGFAGVKLGFYLLNSIAASSVASCTKDELSKSNSYVYVRSAEGEELHPMDGIEGAWSTDTHIGQISGEGYTNERIQIYLPSLLDTGNYPDPGINNIYYSDGVSFNANGFRGGTIHISRIDSSSVIGDFKVALTDTHDGTETRTIAGEFKISAR